MPQVNEFSWLTSTLMVWVMMLMMIFNVFFMGNKSSMVKMKKIKFYYSYNI